MTRADRISFIFLDFSFRVSVCVFDIYLKANGFISINLASLRDWDLQAQSLSRKSLRNLPAALLCFANDALQHFANGLAKSEQIMEFDALLFFFSSSPPPSSSRHLWSCVRHPLQNGHVAGRDHRADEGEGRTPDGGLAPAGLFVTVTPETWNHSAEDYDQAPK